MMNWTGNWKTKSFPIINILFIGTNIKCRTQASGFLNVFLIS